MSFTLIVIAGPTASGKSALAEKLSEQFHIPIISADSRQFYKELKIGTARPDLEKLSHIPYFFCGNKSILETYNAGDYEKDVLAFINQIKNDYPCAILCGGSGLYIDAVCKGFSELPKADQNLRNELNLLYKNNGIHALVSLLPVSIYNNLNNSDRNNPQRLMRHIEIDKNGGKVHAEFKENLQERNFDIKYFQVDLERDILYKRIDNRVDEMIEEGLLEEVRSVEKYRHINALQTVGYNELFEYIDGMYTLKFAIDKIKQHTRNYAKRQLTWFNKGNYVKASPSELYIKLSEEIKKLYK